MANQARPSMGDGRSGHPDAFVTADERWPEANPRAAISISSSPWVARLGAGNVEMQRWAKLTLSTHVGRLLDPSANPWPFVLHSPGTHVPEHAGLPSFAPAGVGGISLPRGTRVFVASYPSKS